MTSAGKSAGLLKFERRAGAIDSLVCVGLDPELGKMPERFRSMEEPLLAFGKFIIDETAPYAAAFKPNMAFYEAHGSDGLRQLEATMEYLRTRCPNVLTICDAKRGDIGNTNAGYAHSIFDGMGCDGVTLHPYLGQESLRPFLERMDKLSIVLCRTSNPGAGEFQDLQSEGEPLWKRVAMQVSREWNAAGNCMLVVGATYPEEMRAIREAAPELTFLVPGLGAQGGDVAAVVNAGLQASGLGLILASSRAILYSADPAAAAMALRDEINRARKQTVSTRKALHAAR